MTESESHDPGQFVPPPPPAPPVAQNHPAQPPTYPQQQPAYPVQQQPAYPVAPVAPPQGYAAPPQGYAAPPQGYAAPPQGYAAPPQGYPAAVPPGYPAQAYPAPGYPMPAHPQAAPARGLLPWVLGFLILIPIPFLGGLVSGIAMAASGGSSRRAGGAAAENARSALNWGLTYLMVSTLLIILHVVLLIGLTVQQPATGFYPLGIPITLYFAVSLLHLVLVIVGTVRVSSGGVMRVPFAIPFSRAR